MLFVIYLENSNSGPKKRVKIFPVLPAGGGIGELTSKQVHPKNAEKTNIARLLLLKGLAYEVFRGIF
jgi:hypothetical protein